MPRRRKVVPQHAYLIREGYLDTPGTQAFHTQQNRESRNKYSSGLHPPRAINSSLGRQLSVFFFFSSSCGGAATNLIPTRVAWTSTAFVKGAFSDVTRCRLRHRRTELHTGSYFIGLSDFSRMRPFGLGSDISFSYTLNTLKCGGQ